MNKCKNCGVELEKIEGEWQHIVRLSGPWVGMTYEHCKLVKAEPEDRIPLDKLSEAIRPIPVHATPEGYCGGPESGGAMGDVVRTIRLEDLEEACQILLNKGFFSNKVAPPVTHLINEEANPICGIEPESETMMTNQPIRVTCSECIDKYLGKPLINVGRSNEFYHFVKPGWDGTLCGFADAKYKSSHTEDVTCFDCIVLLKKAGVL